MAYLFAFMFVINVAVAEKINYWFLGFNNGEHETTSASLSDFDYQHAMQVCSFQFNFQNILHCIYIYILYIYIYIYQFIFTVYD